MFRVFMVTLLGLLLMSGLVSSAQGAPPKSVTVVEDPVGGTVKFRKIRRFGNRNRIESLTPSASEGDAILVEDPEGRVTYKKIRRFGNRDRIARKIDATERDLSGRVVFLEDRFGRTEIVSMKRFGNRNRIEKRLGSDERE